MSDVRLEPVTAENWRACAAVTVRPEQSRFVAPVTYYLCLCAYGDTWQPLAVYDEDTVVGFCMWGVDDDASRWIGGLVIDARAQRRGIARQVVSQLIDRFVAQPGCPGAALSYEPDNHGAQALYASLGFRETGETEDEGNEVVARRTFGAGRAE